MASKPCPATEAPCELKGAATGEAHAALPTGRIDGGEATQKLSYGTIQVKNEPGEPKNSIHLQSRWNCDPHLIFAIFTCEVPAPGGGKRHASFLQQLSHAC